MDRPSLRSRLTVWAKALKRNVVLLWLAARDPHVPLLAKLLAGLVAAYALSPIDLIPDFIPILGYLDDLILVPLGIWAALRLIPPAVLASLRERAATFRPPPSRAARAAILAIWLVALVALIWLIGQLITG